MNFLILIYLLVVSPKLLWQWLRKGKRHPALLQRLGFNIPKTDKPVIWIHAVSVGEVKAAKPLFLALREKEKGAFFLITTTTATGQSEAKRSLGSADAFAYLPIDLSWVVRRWVSALNPKTFILIETDLWYNLLKALKKNGTQIFLVSGKLSARSAARFKLFSWVAKKLFSNFDAICVQNEEHRVRFWPLVPDPKKLHITGNLKLDLPSEPTLPFQIPSPAITLSCTHAGEEDLLLDALAGFPYFLILAPRHPERFKEVANLLEKKKIPFSRWSEQSFAHSVLLLDTMGQLPTCYAHSQLAIVAGSYVPYIGGHNVLEPCLYGTPVFFGPHTEAQTELAALAIHSGAGKMAPIEDLGPQVLTFLNDSSLRTKMHRSALDLIEKNRGATTRTLEKIWG